MSSISPQKNFIRVILHKSQLCHPSQTYLSYTLSITYNNSASAETEPILIPSITFGEKNFYFDLGESPLKKENQITISAVTRTMFVIKKTFAKVTIPFSLSKCTNQKQWYFLKDDEEEIVLKVLIALHSDIIVNNKKKISHSDTVSDLYQRRELTHNNSSFAYGYSYINKSMLNLNTNSLLNYSKANLTFTQQNVEGKNLLSIIEKDNECNNSGDTDLLNIEEATMENIETAISDKTDKILEMQKKTDTQSDMIKAHEEMHIRKKNVVNKEKDKLKESLKKMEKNKKDYETRNINLNENIIKYEKDSYKHQIQKEIDEYDKQTFLDLNYIYMANDIFQFGGNYPMTIRTTANASIMLNDPNENISRSSNNNIHQKINSQRKLKIEYLNSKHLNSTNFTSNCSELNLNNNMEINNNVNSNNNNNTNVVGANSCSTNRHLSPNSNKIISKGIKKERTKLIDSLEGNLLLSKELPSSSSNNNNNLRKSKRTLIEFDNIKVIQVKSSSKKDVTPFTNKKKLSTKSKNKIIVNNNTNSNNQTTTNYLATSKSKIKSNELNSKKTNAIPHHNIDIVNLNIY